MPRTVSYIRRYPPLAPRRAGAPRQRKDEDGGKVVFQALLWSDRSRQCLRLTALKSQDVRFRVANRQVGPPSFWTEAAPWVH